MKENSNPSQEKRILQYLQSGACLTALQALERFQCLRLASRIASLRKAGYNIENLWEEHGGKRYAKYRLSHEEN